MRCASSLAMGLFAVLVSSPVWAQDVDCEAARCTTEVQQALANCAANATNHGRYVSCVARAVRSLVPTSCRGKTVRCAARSTIGKDGFVACQIPVSTCDLTTGTCADDATVTCTADADCGTKCRIKSSSDLCTAAGGSGGPGSCCINCP